MQRDAKVPVQCQREKQRTLTHSPHFGSRFFVSIYLSVCLPACLPACLYMSVCLSFFLLSFDLSTYLIYLSIYWSICARMFVGIFHLSTYLPTYLLIYRFSYVAIHLSMLFCERALYVCSLSSICSLEQEYKKKTYQEMEARPKKWPSKASKMHNSSMTEVNKCPATTQMKYLDAKRKSQMAIQNTMM